MYKEKNKKIIYSIFVAFITFLMIGFVSGIILTSRAKKEVKTIEKNEMTNITYEIVLNNGEVYNQNNSYSFAPSLVDHIDVNFEYYNDNNPDEYTLSAYIVTYVKSVNLDGNTVDAVIDSVETIKNKVAVTEDSTDIKFSIDYQDYATKLANYINDNGLSNESSGKVELVLVADNSKNSISNKAQVSISLLSDAISVDVHKTIRNVSSTLLGNNANLLFIATVVCLVLAIFVIVVFYYYYKLSKMSNYKREVYKIFALHKNALVESELSNIEREKLIKVASFKELIKVFNSVSIPIIYSEDKSGYEFILKVGINGYYYKLENKE